MIDITEVVLNFQKLLIAIANSLSAIGLRKGSDEWEELTENAFNALVINHLTDKFDILISRQYEMWGPHDREILIRVGVGETIFVGVESSLYKDKYRYNEIPKSEKDIEFAFVEFGNPYFVEGGSEELEYAMGLDKEGRVVCARKEVCKFYIAP